MASPKSVVIVTCDGYEAWGRALDPVGAATDYSLVDAFTRFLEKRVVTQNMALLRRMMAEYFCHCETTVREFVAQCSTQISIGPFGIEDPVEVAAAERVLRQPRSFTRSGLSASVFTFLVTKLRTARASLLMQFFVEFCQGEDAALREFVEKREGFVSIFPLAAPQLEHSPFAPSDGIPFESVEPQPMPPPPVFNVATPRNQLATKTSKPKIQPTGKKRKLTKQEQLDYLFGMSEEEDVEKKPSGKARAGGTDAEHASDDDDAGLDRPCKTTFNRPDEAMNKVKAKLVIAMQEVEKKEPWTKVFPSSMPLPFDETEHPDLACMLRDFWQRHARTAWERNFWAPLRLSIEKEELMHRRMRQRNATLAFERVIAACFDRFGAKFFYKLDRKHHPGWWYRSACVDLLGLSAIIGYDRSAEYIQKQQLMRFPDCGQPLPLRTANIGIIQRQQDARVSAAMWLHSAKPEIEAIKSKVVAYVAKKEKKKQQKKSMKLSGKQAAAHEKATRPHPVDLAAYLAQEAGQSVDDHEKATRPGPVDLATYLALEARHSIDDDEKERRKEGRNA